MFIIKSMNLTHTSSHRYGVPLTPHT